MLDLLLGGTVSCVVFCLRGFMVVGLCRGLVVCWVCFILSLVLLDMLVVFWYLVMCEVVGS